MRSMLQLAVVSALFVSPNCLLAQVATPDPDVQGPVRRGVGAAAEALGAPGVEQRMEERQERRDLLRDVPEADRWRYRWHNNEWWYYTPQNRWRFYRDNRWNDFDRSTFIAPRRRYETGYRGPSNNRTYIRRGLFGRRIDYR